MVAVWNDFIPRDHRKVAERRALQRRPWVEISLPWASDEGSGFDPAFVLAETLSGGKSAQDQPHRTRIARGSRKPSQAMIGCYHRSPVHARVKAPSLACGSPARRHRIKTRV